MVGIVDIGIGNIQSIKNWMNRCNVNWEIIQIEESLQKYSLIILPGVGSAKLYMDGLISSRFYDKLIDAARDNIRILGICLGAQVLFDDLDEDGGVKGLGLIKGKVERLNTLNSNTGWIPFELNKEHLNSNWLKYSIGNSKKRRLIGRVFFNHNFGIYTDDNEALILNISHSNYNQFGALVIKKNIIGIQFHPEKSQKMGEEILKMIL